jgi:Domain of unknown function (DUF929)
MGKASRTKVDVSRREKIAAQREAQRRAERRRRMLIAAGSIVVVAAIVLTFVIIKLNGKPASAGSASNGPTGAALAAVVAKTTTVPASVLDAVGDGGGAVTGKPAAISSGSALTANGKPEMLYIGAEYCPYCAAERWAMIVALSRFGTFSGLSTVHSSSIDVYANTPTFTFYKSAYTSPYLTFTPVETTTNVPDSSSTSGYVPLQTPTSAQTALWYKYTSSGTIPFIDFGGKAFISGVSYSNQVLSGLSWSQIAADLSNPNSPVAKAVDGTANYITAAICKMTGNQPASACTSTVQSLESQV